MPQSITPGQGDSLGSLTFLQKGAGAVPRTALSKMQDVVSIADFLGGTADGVTDNTAALLAAIASLTPGGTVTFPKGTYVIGSVPITQPVILDFQGSYIKPNTVGVMFSYAIPNADLFADSLVLRNGSVIPGPQAPANVVKLLHGTDNINPLLENFNINALTATDSYVWNAEGYGLRLLNCKFRDGTAPAGLKCSHSDVDPTIFSNAIVVSDCDFSNLSGVGVATDGGDMVIRGGVIEGCASGGVQHTDTAFMNGLLIDGVHFEQNSSFDIKCGAAGGHYTVRSCTILTQGIVNHILMAAATILTVDGTTFYSGGVAGAAPISYVGINNIQRNAAAGYTGTFDAEIADTLRGNLKNVFINKSNLATATILAAGNGDLIAAQPLAGTAYDEWHIVAYNNGNFGFGEAFRVYAGRINAAIVGTILVDQTGGGYASTVTVVDNGNGTYKIHVVNASINTVIYWATWIRNTRMFP